jgi:hypothetical protein
MLVGKYCVTCVGKGRVTTMIGRKMNLKWQSARIIGIVNVSIPHADEEYGIKNSKQLDAPFVGLLIHFPQAVEKCC